MSEVRATATASGENDAAKNAGSGATAGSKAAARRKRGRESGKSGSVRKLSGRTRATEKPSKGKPNKPAPVISVAELARIVCPNPDRRKKRLKMCEALRESGLDESRMAVIFAGAVEKLSRDKEAGAAGVTATKLLLDLAKKVTHWLEPPKSAGGSEANEAPPFVRLIHSVPRPVRTE